MNRASFLSTSVAAAAIVPGGSALVERRADFDEAGFVRAINRPADVRQVWEAVSFHPAVLNNVKNGLNGLQFGFGYPADRLAMAFAPHGPSSAYNYSDEIWQRYKIGEALGLRDAAGNTVTSNTFLAPTQAFVNTPDPEDPFGFYQDTSIVTLQDRGVVFLTCHTAVEEQARTIVKKGFAPDGMTPEAVADDILTHLVQGTHVVPAMIAAIAVLQQRYHYSYVTMTFA